MISVVVPTYARPERLAACLDGLAGLEVPEGGFEVVVVDDGSPRPLDDVVARHRGDLDVRLHRQPNAGPARARNVGAGLARGELLAFTDDDCVPEPGWLVGMAAAARTHPGALLGGATTNARAHDRYAVTSQLLVDHVCSYRGEQPRFFPSNNIAVPTEGFLAIGGFDERFPRAAGEDRDLCDRWLASGRPIAPAPDAVVHHHHAFTLRSFWRQHHNYGRGAYRFQRARAARTGEGVEVESPRFYLELVARPFRHAPPARAAVLSGLMLVTQVANTAGYVAEARAARLRPGPPPTAA